MRWIQIQKAITDQSIEMDAVFCLTNLMKWIQIQEAITDQSIEMDAVFSDQSNEMDTDSGSNN